VRAIPMAQDTPSPSFHRRPCADAAGAGSSASCCCRCAGNHSAPRILSIGPVRAYVLKPYQSGLNGAVEADDTGRSAGISGIAFAAFASRMQGPADFRVCPCATGLPAGVLRGHYDLGKTPSTSLISSSSISTPMAQITSGLFKSPGDSHRGGKEWWGRPRAEASSFFSGDIQAHRARATVVLHKRTGRCNPLC